MGAAEGQPPDPGFRRVNCGPSAWGGTASQHLWAQVAPVNLNDSPEKGQLRSTGQRPRSGAPGSPQYRCLVVHKIHLCCSRCHGAQSLSERDAQAPRTKQGRSCWRDQWVQGRGISSELRRLSRGFPGIWEGASQSGVSTSKGPWGESVGRSKRNSLAGVGKTTQGPMRGRTSFSRPQPSSALRDGLAATASPEQELWSSLVHDGAPAPRVTSAWLPVGAQLGLLPQDVKEPREVVLDLSWEGPRALPWSWLRSRSRRPPPCWPSCEVSAGSHSLCGGVLLRSAQNETTYGCQGTHPHAEQLPKYKRKNLWDVNNYRLPRWC